MTTATSEQPIYTDQNVHVSTSRLIIHGTTYALSNVTSVRMLQQKPNLTFAVLLIIVGLIALAVKAYLFGLVALVVGVGLCFVLKSTYFVAIGSASGEHSAMSNKNGQYIEHVVQAINEAIIARG